ncbi:hypothetical protein L2E82_35578 [Cichorium intybus]|uniref:Uncharacterized protein n=1 Tax=Cichorium intybus TaxID=13427 RepID=A0ACB9BPI8_CICIN|nr:hypothetical protein L2E82_35578 [Cichorium intybus]
MLDNILATVNAVATSPSSSTRSKDLVGNKGIKGVHVYCMEGTGMENYRPPVDGLELNVVGLSGEFASKFFGFDAVDLRLLNASRARSSSPSFIGFDWFYKHKEEDDAPFNRVQPKRTPQPQVRSGPTAEDGVAERCKRRKIDKDSKIGVEATGWRRFWGRWGEDVDAKST